MSKHAKHIISNCQGHKIIMTKNPLNVYKNYEKIQHKNMNMHERLGYCLQICYINLQYSTSCDHWLDDLTKFGYNQSVKVNTFVNPFIS